VSAGKIVIFGWAESEHIRRWASGLQSRGYDLLVVSLGGEPLDSVATHIIPASSRLAPFTAASEAARIARRFQPDLVHVHYASTFGFWGMRSRVRPLLVSVWGSDIVSFPSNWLSRRYLKKVLSRAEHLTVTSRFLENKVTDFLPGAGSKCDLVPFGVDLPDVRRGIPDGPVRLCFLKSHKPVYGPDILLKALAEASRDIKKLARRLNLADRVDFPGMLSHGEVYQLLEDSTILVMPSLEEAFGVVALEASVCGRPVITSDVGGTSEVVINGQTGVLVPPGDVSALAKAIVKLARDRQRCEQMGQAGYGSLDLMDALYQRVIHGKT